MRRAAENLVPGTVELGGKSPVIAAGQPTPSRAANSAFDKLVNAGQPEKIRHESRSFLVPCFMTSVDDQWLLILAAKAVLLFPKPCRANTRGALSFGFGRASAAPV